MTYDATERSVAKGSPIELYEFSYQAQYLRFTSAADPYTYLGNDYQPYAVKRDTIGSQAASVEQTLNVTAFRDFPPAALFRVQAPSAIVNLRIYRVHQRDTGQQISTIWIGRVLSVAWQEGSEVVLTCETDLASMKRLALRRRYQLNCPYTLYQVGCSLAAADFGITVTSFSAIGRALTVPDLVGDPLNRYAGGYVVYPSALSDINEIIAIRTSAAGVLQLALTPQGIATAGAMTVFPGCAHTIADCTDFFDNLPNYGGTPFIPNINPFAGVKLF